MERATTVDFVDVVALVAVLKESGLDRIVGEGDTSGSTHPEPGKPRR